jgi:hypothetical protein
MAHDVVVYTQRATPVTVDEIVGTMRVRGVPVE